MAKGRRPAFFHSTIQHHICVLFYWYEGSGARSLGGLPNLSTWPLLAPQRLIRLSVCRTTTALSLSLPGLD